MKSRLEFEQWVPFPIAHVFKFFSNPENLQLIMPEASGTQLIELQRVAPAPSLSFANEKAAGVGSIIATSFRTIPGLPFRSRWIARITEFEWNQHFADVQQKGPFKSWHHRHEFAASAREGSEGTLIRDVIEYEIGFGFVGTWANRVFVRRQMENTFKERQRKLGGLLASSS